MGETHGAIRQKHHPVMEDHDLVLKCIETHGDDWGSPMTQETPKWVPFVWIWIYNAYKQIISLLPRSMNHMEVS